MTKPRTLFRSSGGLTLTLAMALASGANAGTAHIPQPWRSDAVVLGRDEPYNAERFLHELTYRHRQTLPTATDNGIRGTAGSVSGDRLYFDFRFRQDFGFREDQNGFLLDIQRSEDLDGYYQRQLVGFRQNLGKRTEVWLQGDVFSDKAASDIYLSTRHHFNALNWLHFSWILPDYYFNDKTDSADRFDSNPQTFFLQWHQQGETAKEGTTFSLNLTPESRFISQQEALSVESDSQKAAFTHRQELGEWRVHVHVEGERSRRSYAFHNADTSASAEFKRDHLYALGSLALHRHPLSPRIGLSYRHLNERGFFGREINDQGEIQRKEPTLFGEVTMAINNHTRISPGLYLSAPEITRSLEQTVDDQHTGFIGKLALPIEFELSRTDQAVLTLNPTFYLHKAAFGGGNLQLHWPL